MAQSLPDAFQCLGSGMCRVSGAQLEIRCCGCSGEPGSSSAHPEHSLCCALPGRMTASFWSLLVPCGIQRAWAGCAAAEPRLCSLTPYISQYAFPISPPACSTCPSSYPTKSQLTLVCMPAGTDMVIFVLFTVVNSSAFDDIIFLRIFTVNFSFHFGLKAELKSQYQEKMQIHVLVSFFTRGNTPDGNTPSPSNLLSVYFSEHTYQRTSIPPGVTELFFSINPVTSDWSQQDIASFFSAPFLLPLSKPDNLQSTGPYE